MENIGINLPLLIAFLINFGILFVLLLVFGYKPILKMLDQRQAKIRESMEQADHIREQTAKSEEQMKAHLEAARKEGQTIISQATQMGEKVKEEAREDARKEASAVIERARVEIDRDRDKTIEGLRAEFADIAIMAAEKVINESLDKQKHQKLINEVLEESKLFKK
ncbi:MAG TPA: ATP synthase F0 subunit B [Dehalococcoidia bacterium]|nr:ATP synthase F0 subunit B [Dehalococcoidia bacterium]